MATTRRTKERPRSVTLHESQSSAGVIDVRIRELAQLFNSFDPSPFHDRDLDHDAEDHIVGWASELPDKQPLKIVIHLPESEALKARDRDLPGSTPGPVIVLVMDKAELPRYQRLAQALRAAGIRAEMYLGTSGMKAQMKYADRRGAPCVVIQGSDERARGEVQVEDLIEGAKASETIKDAKEWREGRPAQISVPEADLVTAVRDILARHKA